MNNRVRTAWLFLAPMLLLMAHEQCCERCAGVERERERE